MKIGRKKSRRDFDEGQRPTILNVRLISGPILWLSFYKVYLLTKIPRTFRVNETIRRFQIQPKLKQSKKTDLWKSKIHEINICGK